MQVFPVSIVGQAQRDLFLSEGYLTVPFSDPSPGIKAACRPRACQEDIAPASSEVLELEHVGLCRDNGKKDGYDYITSTVYVGAIVGNEGRYSEPMQCFIHRGEDQSSSLHVQTNNLSLSNRVHGALSTCATCYKVPTNRVAESEDTQKLAPKLGLSGRFVAKCIAINPKPPILKVLRYGAAQQVPNSGDGCGVSKRHIGVPDIWAPFSGGSHIKERQRSSIWGLYGVP